MKFITYYQMSCDIILLLLRAGREFDYVFGIPRNGLTVAAMYSGITGIPMLTDEDKIATSGRVLILDDSWGNGGTMEKYTERHGTEGISYGVVYGRSRTPKYIHQARAIDSGRLMEWEMFTSKRVSYDIDGLICPDVPKGVNYAHYLATAPLMYAPGVPIPCLITARHEKYRKITEDWLKRHGIEYGKLIMSQRASRADRKANTARDNAKACIDNDVPVIIESSDSAAAAISRYGINCISIQSMRLFKGVRKRKKN